MIYPIYPNSDIEAAMFFILSEYELQKKIEEKCLMVSKDQEKKGYWPVHELNTRFPPIRYVHYNLTLHFCT